MLLLLCACMLPAAEPAPLRIAVAADLVPAMAALGDLHRARGGGGQTVIPGSSGLLSRQIAQGAPFDLFMSADVALVDDLVARGHGLAASRAVYARGRLVVWRRAEAGAPAPRLDGLGAERFRRIAIANPAHAPYGRAAEQALERAGLLEALRPRLVFGENVGQTLQFARTGNAEAALVALSLALSTPGGAWSLVDEGLHRPIDQGLMVTTTARDPAGAAAFAATVASPEGRAVLRRCGFVQPGEPPDPAWSASDGTQAGR